MGRRGKSAGALHSAQYGAFLSRLRLARRLSGLTQTQAATALGKSQSYIQKSEAGERRVDAVELQAFAKLYGQALDWFFLSPKP